MGGENITNNPVQNYEEVKQKLQINKYNCSTSMLNNKQIKVNASDEAEYRQMTD